MSKSLIVVPFSVVLPKQTFPHLPQYSFKDMMLPDSQRWFGSCLVVFFSSGFLWEGGGGQAQVKISLREESQECTGMVLTWHDGPSEAEYTLCRGTQSVAWCICAAVQWSALSITSGAPCRHTVADAFPPPDTTSKSLPCPISLMMVFSLCSDFQAFSLLFLMQRSCSWCSAQL